MNSNICIDPNVIFAEIEKERKTGELRVGLTKADPCYQISKKNPGSIERVFINGKKDVGFFENGKFKIDQVKTDDLFSR